MKILLQTYLSIFLSSVALGQTVIEGVVTDQTGEGLIGANVYIKDTYDGATTNVDGQFRFETFEEGEQVLVVSFVGFETQEIQISPGDSKNFNIRLKEAFNAMEAVTISAGAFEAGDESKAVILKSLDIAMTAGATADIPAALNTLPGTQRNGESGRLFVRGGTAGETKVFVDGMESSGFYGTGGPAIPSRSRFSPFLFKGTFFSTGGYSAEYGQALSSALILKTLDVEPESQVDISLMTVGVDVSATKSWDNQSFYGKLGYLNLNPYNKIISQRVHWNQGTVSPDATLSYKKDFDNGAKLRSMVMTSTSSFSLERETKLNEQGYDAIDVRNDFAFATISYERPVGETDMWYVGSSVTHNYERTQFNHLGSASPVTNYHAKTKYNHSFSDRTFLNAGVEVFHREYKEHLSDSASRRNLGFNQTRPVLFAEVDHYISEKWILRGGVRSEFESYMNTFNWSPRVSLAHSIGEHSQVSVATGLFYQDSEEDYLRFTNNLDQERAAHYILNYQRIKNDQVFRVEGYLKDYDKLVKYTDAFDPDTFTNEGDGYAYGMDVFWRDRTGIKYFDYWVSYSWLKSERDFQNFPEAAAPSFTSEHNLSLVVKRWMPRFNAQVGATYSVTSGRPYNDPVKTGFNQSTTPVYQDLSYNMAWLPKQNLILYFSASNLLGQEQVFGYNFSNTPNTDGQYLSEAVKLPAKRFIFIGCFITIGGKNNQLQNL
ncbi:MAG: TonB-dependent receptor [Cyclobacteriaceae bacterium]